MENQERGSGLLGLMGYGMGDFGEDPRKRGHQAYVFICNDL